MDISSYFAYPSAFAADPDASRAFLDEAAEDEWDILLAAMQTVVLGSGETAFAEGQPDLALYLLTDGVIQVSQRGIPAAEISAPPAEVLNTIAFLDGDGCAATARAVTDVRLLRLSPDAFESLAARQPQLARRIALELARRVAWQLRRGSGSLP